MTRLPSSSLHLGAALLFAACTPSMTNPRPIRTVTASETTTPTSIAVRTFLVTWLGAANAPPEVRRTRAQAEIRARTLAGLVQDPTASFGEIAREHGDRTTGLDGRVASVGRLVRSGDGTLDPAVERRAFALGVGGIAGPIETAGGFVFVMRTRDPDSAPTEIAARHILISFHGAQGAAETVTRTREEAEALAAELLARLRASPNDWVALASSNSDDPGSPEGGDLGRFPRGTMQPLFERAAFALAVNQISDVVETPFGFHIIQRTE